MASDDFLLIALPRDTRLPGEPFDEWVERMVRERRMVFVKNVKLPTALEVLRANSEGDANGTETQDSQEDIGRSSD